MHSLLPIVLLPLLLLGCTDSDEPDQRAAGTATTTTTTTVDECPGGDPALPDRADGTPAEVVAVTGDLRFAIVDHGASVEVVSVFRLAGCEVRQVELDGQPAQFPVGGTVTHGVGLACEDGQITVLTATSDDGETYQATAVTYDVEGDELVEADRDASTIEASDDPDTLRAYYDLGC